MKKLLCDICGGEKEVVTLRLPVYRMFDGCDGRTHYDKPHVMLQDVDICQECLRAVTNIKDHNIMGYGGLTLTTNPIMRDRDGSQGIHQ